MNRLARLGTYGAVVGVATLLVWVAAWSPAASAVSDAQARVESAAMQNSRLALMVGSAETYAERGAEGHVALDAATTAVPANPALAAYLLFVDDAARTCGCVVRGLNPRPEGSEVKAPPGMSGIGIDLAVVGTIDQVQAFLVLVSRLPRAMVIDSLQINQETDRLVELSMVARIFRVADAPGDDTAPAS